MRLNIQSLNLEELRLPLLAMVLLTACTPTPPAEVDVLLRPEAQGGASYTLRISSSYFIRETNLREATSSGTDLLGLWAVYPELEGMSEKNRPSLTNGQTPSKAVQFFLRVALPWDKDWATERLEDRLTEPEDSPTKLRAASSASNESVREYEYVNSPEHWKAYFLTGAQGPVFIECRGTLCKAYRSWQGKLTLQYHFFGGEIADFARLDRDLVGLVGTFSVAAYAGAASP